MFFKSLVLTCHVASTSWAIGILQGPVLGLPLLEVVCSPQPQEGPTHGVQHGGLFLLRLSIALPQGSGHSPGHIGSSPTLVMSPACCTLMATSPWDPLCTSFESVPGSVGRGQLRIFLEGGSGFLEPPSGSGGLSEVIEVLGCWPGAPRNWPGQEHSVWCGLGLCGGRVFAY